MERIAQVDYFRGQRIVALLANGYFLPLYTYKQWITFAKVYNMNGYSWKMRTEKEKMLAGEIYDANNDGALLRERAFSKEFCYQFNQLKPSSMIERKVIIRKLFNKTGKNFTIEPSFYCDYGYNIEIGENFYSNHHLVILDGAKVTFGDNVFIAPNCSFYTAGHPLDIEWRNKGLEYAYPITIGSNVWIGGGVTVLPGVTIGSGTTIGAGSVVTKDIPENSLAVGNPCKVIRKLQ